MQLTYAPEQEDFRAALRGFLGKVSKEADIRSAMATDDGYEPATWRRMAEELEIQGLLVPERHGGAGYGPRELVLVFEELGYALACAPVLGTVALAVPLLVALDDETANADLLPAIAAGTTVATVALLDDPPRWADLGAGTTAREDGGGWRLSGRKPLVIDGAAATLLLTVARTASGPSVFAVDTAADGVRRSVPPVLDQTRKLATFDLDDVPARLIGEEGGAADALEHMLELGAIALAAEQVGGAQRVLDMAVAYAKERFQFGRAIGSFQAVKHRLADVLTDVELARSTAYHAGATAATGEDDLRLATSLAAVRCGETYVRAAGDAIQVHGGIGVTWEHTAHLFFKRAKSSQLLLRPVAFHRARLAGLIEQEAA